VYNERAIVDSVSLNEIRTNLRGKNYGNRRVQKGIPHALVDSSISRHL